MTEDTLQYIPVDFILLLLGLFGALIALVLIYHFYNTIRIKRLVSPRRDHYKREP